MAFAGYLIAFEDNGGNTIPFPMKYMRYETFEIAPDQRLDLDSTRDTTGVLHRTVLDHTATKVSFTMPSMNKYAMQDALSYLKAAWNYNTGNEKARKCLLTYYDEFEDDYKQMVCYTPTITFTIRNIDGNDINYNETKISFIEY